MSTNQQVEAALKAGLETHDWEMFDAQTGDVGEAAEVAIRTALDAAHPTITTAKGLDALPVGSVVLDSTGESFQRVDIDGLPSLWGSSDMITAGLMLLPATVLHSG